LDGVATVSDRYVGYFHEVGADTDGEWTRASGITDNPQDEVLTSGNDAYLTVDMPDFKARPNRSTTFEINLDGDTHIYAVCPSLRGPWEGTTDEVRSTSLMASRA
jgi:heat shock protein HslJ